MTPNDVKAGARACGVMTDTDRAQCFFRLGQRAEQAAARSRSPKKMRVLAADLKSRAESIWGGVPVRSPGKKRR
jgi:hypothetical protein